MERIVECCAASHLSNKEGFFTKGEREYGQGKVSGKASRSGKRKFSSTTTAEKKKIRGRFVLGWGNPGQKNMTSSWTGKTGLDQGVGKGE